MPPAVFTVVMGTGALSVATLEMSTLAPCLYWPALGLNFLNFALFCIFSVWGVCSWSKQFKITLAHFRQPDHCALYSASGIALLVLGTQALRFNLGETFAFCVWSLGVIGAFAFNFGILFRFFLLPNIKMLHITPALYIPVASMVVVPVAGAPLAANAAPIASEFAILASILALGGGLALYVGLFSILLQRHLLARPLPDLLAPTLWIHIAPIGWGGVALIAFAADALPPQYYPVAQMIAMLLFGAAFWWLVMDALICVRAIARRTLSFSLTWWSFIFPIGSVTILSRKLELAAPQALFPLLWGLMAALWLYCAIRTIPFLIRKF